MSKLHELLAVEADLKGVSDKVISEAIVTFTKKTDHFQGFTKRYEPYRDGLEHFLPSESKELVTTVKDKLDYVVDHIARYLNAVAQKERTNQAAKADIVVDGITIAQHIPATFLLGMESKLKDIRKVFESIPTLSPGIRWEEDTQKGKGVFVAPITERLRTEKKMKPVVLYEATDKHPAQVKESTEDVAIGKYVQTDWSSMLSPADKSVLIGRVDKLTQAIKRARQRANEQEVIDIQVATDLFDYILKG
jgi:hypothetical protein